MSDRIPCQAEYIALRGEADLVNELCQTFLSDREGWVAVFRAFLDESGTHDKSPVIVVGGYMARPEQWKFFARRWKRVLDPTGIKVFHSADCNGFHGEFSGWERAERDALVANLLAIIPDERHIGVAIGLVLRDYDDALSGKAHLRDLLGSPYEACFHWCLSTLLAIHRSYESDEPIAIVHEENQFEAEAKRAYKYLRETYQPSPLISLTFGSKREFLPLQAADVLAYEVGKFLLNQGNPRRSFEALMPEGKRPRIRFYDKVNMPTLLNQLEGWHAANDEERKAMFAAFLEGTGASQT